MTASSNLHPEQFSGSGPHPLMEGMNTVKFRAHVQTLHARGMDLGAPPLTHHENDQLQLGIKAFGIKKVRGG